MGGCQLEVRDTCSDAPASVEEIQKLAAKPGDMAEVIGGTKEQFDAMGIV